MISTQVTKKVLGSILLGLCMSVSLHANTIIVGPGGDIQAAINSVSVGGTVKVEAGTYSLTQQLTIDKNLTLIGAGMDTTIIQSPDTSNLTTTFNYTGTTARTYTPIIMVEDATSVTIKNMTIDGRDQSVFGTVQGFTGLGYHNASGTISNVHVLNILESTEPTGYQEGTAILGANDTGTNTLIVQNTVLDHFQKQGLLLIGTGLTGTVKGNVITGTNVEANPNGIELYDGSTATITNNVVSNLTNPSSQQCSGILIFNASNVSVQNNQLMDNDNGIYLINCDNALVKNNNLQNCSTGIGIDESGSTSINSYTVNLNTVSYDSVASTYALYLISPQSMDLVSPVVTTQANTVNNAGVGLYIQGSPDGTAGPHLSMNSDSFLGASQYFIQLVLCPVNIWPTSKGVSYNGVDWSNMTSDQFDELAVDPATQQIVDKNTNPSLGLVLQQRT